MPREIIQIGSLFSVGTGFRRDKYLVVNYDPRSDKYVCIKNFTDVLKDRNFRFFYDGNMRLEQVYTEAEMIAIRAAQIKKFLPVKEYFERSFDQHEGEIEENFGIITKFVFYSYYHDVLITSSNNYTHQTGGYWVKVTFNGKMLYRNIQIAKCRFTTKEAYHGYIHSHIRSVNGGSTDLARFDSWHGVCNGDGPWSKFLMKLKAKYNILDIAAFMAYIKTFLENENHRSPHILASSVTTGRTRFTSCSTAAHRYAKRLLTDNDSFMRSLLTKIPSDLLKFKKTTHNGDKYIVLADTEASLNTKLSEYVPLCDGLVVSGENYSKVYEKDGVLYSRSTSTADSFGMSISEFDNRDATLKVGSRRVPIELVLTFAAEEDDSAYTEIVNPQIFRKIIKKINEEIIPGEQAKIGVNGQGPNTPGQ